MHTRTHAHTRARARAHTHTNTHKRKLYFNIFYLNCNDASLRMKMHRYYAPQSTSNPSRDNGCPRSDPSARPEHLRTSAIPPPPITSPSPLPSSLREGGPVNTFNYLPIFGNKRPTGYINRLDRTESTPILEITV